MTEPSSYSFRRYLDAKRTVDERATNRRVRDRLGRELADRRAPLRVLEVGAGTGATVERLASWGAMPTAVRYTAVDVDAELVAAARDRLTARTDSPAFEPRPADGALVAERGGGRFVVELLARDAFELAEATDRTWDLLVAQAFCDLTDVREALERLLPVVAPGGLCYFPLTFDGGTWFHPPVDPAFDEALARRYHDRMDAGEGTRGGRGDSRAGRRLLAALPEFGGSVLAAGGADWVVVPDADGYPADEAYFLHHIVETVRGALADDQSLDAARFDRWVERRHRQVEAGRLGYVAHQLDVLGRAP